MEYHNKIQTLKQHEIELKKKEKEAEEALKSAEKNYMLLKQV